MNLTTSKKAYLSAGLITVGTVFIALSIFFATQYFTPQIKTWKFQSIDTMKYSRDLSREKLGDNSFDKIINDQMKLIANTGATHVAIATPYDEEFLPILKRWVVAARKNDLKIWFRGNFSGWEGWFGYKKISRQAHIEKTRQFVTKNLSLLEDGDIYTACPECENGGPGDPRITLDTNGHRKFLIEEYKMVKGIFKQNNKKVIANYISMNADVAILIMDRATTKELDGIVTIDHYVKDPQQLKVMVDKLAILSQGKVVLGEFGAPIPEITGDFSEVEQQEWLERSMSFLKQDPNLIGLNYWVNIGGSTELWNSHNTPKASVTTITKFYRSQ